MSSLPVVSGRECVRALQQVGFVLARQGGSHIILSRQNPYTGRSAGHEELDRGTLRGILRHADIDVVEFAAFLRG